MTAQLIAPANADCDHQILCCYANLSSQIQIARINNVANWYFERVVFPGQRLLLEVPAEAQLEIHTGTMASAILSDRICCRSIQVLD